MGYILVLRALGYGILSIDPPREDVCGLNARSSLHIPFAYAVNKLKNRILSRTSGLLLFRVYENTE
jgi:hypothetical protein